MKYNIQGEPMPVVICHLEAGESMITERGSMVWMSANMRMETKAGGLGKALGRMFGGESLFQNTYTAEGGPGMIAFASSFPGTIRAVEITPNMPVIAQKSAFLAATPGVDLSIHFQKKVGAGFFGGEGFIMQKLSGHGMAFLEIDGSAVEYTLGAGTADHCGHRQSRHGGRHVPDRYPDRPRREERPLRRRGSFQHRRHRSGARRIADDGAARLCERAHPVSAGEVGLTLTQQNG